MFLTLKLLKYESIIRNDDASCKIYIYIYIYMLSLTSKSTHIYV